MRKNNIKYDLDDLLIIPKRSTDIASRYSDVNSYYEGSKRLPIINAPMDTVVSLENMTTFRECNINVALPRTIPMNYYYTNYQQTDDMDNFPDHTFISLGLKEMKEIINSNHDYVVGEYYILDVANGHMEEVYNTAKAFKEAFPSTKLMVGNIANPETYDWYARGKFVDYIRVGIGNVNSCITTKQTSVG